MALVAAACAGTIVVLLARHRRRGPTSRWSAGGAPDLASTLAARRAPWASPARPADPLPDIVRLRSAVASGASAWQACAEVVASGGPWAEGMQPFVGAAPGRAPLSRSLDGWARRSGDPAARAVADAVALAGETGGSLVAALDAVADTVRERAAIDREVRALASSARASAGVLVATPFAFGVAVAVLDARVRSFVATPAGVACLLAGAALDLVGAWWMHRQIAAVA